MQGELSVGEKEPSRIEGYIVPDDRRIVLLFYSEILAFRLKIRNTMIQTNHSKVTCDCQRQCEEIALRLARSLSDPHRCLSASEWCLPSRKSDDHILLRRPQSRVIFWGTHIWTLKLDLFLYSEIPKTVSYRIAGESTPWSVLWVVLQTVNIWDIHLSNTAKYLPWLGRPIKF